MKLRVTLGVVVAWVLIAVVIGGQNTIRVILPNPDATVTLWPEVRAQLINSLPWIPMTLVAIALAARLPITRSTWRRRLWVHLAALLVFTWIANAGVVLGFWWTFGVWNGFGALADGALLWSTIRVPIAVMVYGLTVGGTQAWIYFREARRRELSVARLEAQLARARFQALNEQIRPHFLFNTLHTIGQLWRSGREDAADAMLDRLGALFQRVRASTDRAAIPLADELSMVEDYLAIERARFSDRLSVDVSATPEARACLVPPLLLQPLVENAIRHGISASPDAGCVGVRARLENGRLFIEVKDDGPGMANASPTPGSGTGLSNTRERLAHAYGDAQSVTVESDNGDGTRILLELPATRDEDEVWSDD